MVSREPEEGANADASAPPCRILVVDDDAFSLKIAVWVLRSAGYTEVIAVDTASMGLELLECTGHGIDIVLCDLNMPGIDGIEFIRQLGDRSFGGAVVLMSGENPQVLRISAELAKARSLRVLGALQKPIQLDSLIELMRRWKLRPLLRDELIPIEVTAGHFADALRNCEIFPVFQPQVALKNGRVVGVEALARWISPTLGPVPPTYFVALAEQHGLIDVLTDKMMSAVLPQMTRWSRQGLKLRTAVNISMLSLRRLDFADRLIAQVVGARIEPSALTLEITESQAMEDALSCIDTLVRIRLRGIGISIDDFGTRYASLAQLRDLPFTELKVDKSFVHESAANDAACAILESSIALGRSLGMRVVAEGVETGADWSLVERLQCDVAQGYFVTKPMPADDVAAWTASWRLPAGARH